MHFSAGADEPTSLMMSDFMASCLPPPWSCKQALWCLIVLLPASLRPGLTNKPYDVCFVGFLPPSALALQTSLMMSVFLASFLPPPWPYKQALWCVFCWLPSSLRHGLANKPYDVWLFGYQQHVHSFSSLSRNRLHKFSRGAETAGPMYMTIGCTSSTSGNMCLDQYSRATVVRAFLEHIRLWNPQTKQRWQH